MNVDINEEPIAGISQQAEISIAFHVDRVLDVESNPASPGHFTLSERRLDTPYEKNYDAIEGQHPSQWPARFDTSNWSLIVARVSGRRVGGAVIALNTPGLTTPDDHNAALLWDIRVAPDLRGHGIGSALFQAAEKCALAKGRTHLKAETQNINVPACRFYARQGCQLQQIHRAAYPQFPHEIQMIWCKNLTAAP